MVNNNSTQNKLDELKEEDFVALAPTGTWWNPSEEGERVRGVVVDEIDMGEDGVSTVIETHPGVWMNLPTHVNLMRQLKHANTGDVVQVVYEGTIVHPKNPKHTIKQYRAAVHRPAKEGVGGGS